MRRLVAGIGLAAAVAAALGLAGAGGEERGYRVAAIFDNVAHLIPGQDVRIAGARVGTVADIRLTRDRKALVEMDIRTGFAPFRADASCTIRPQSLIGEKYIQCKPGTPDAEPLKPGPDGIPTVPLSQTSSPVDIDLVFASFRRPYGERLALLINELGTGLAGRPAELAAAIRRANPALREAHELLRILDRDRRVLRRLVERSDTVLAELAGRAEATERFIEHAGSAATATARRRDELAESVRRLPALLDQLEPAAATLTQLARDGRPVLRDLRAAAPAAHDLVGDFDPLADAARPALRELSETSRTGRKAVQAARRPARQLRTLSAKLPPLVDLTRELLVSFREAGGPEGLQRFVHYAALSTSRFDAVSHMLPSYQVAGLCMLHMPVPVEGCDAHFGPGRERAGARAISRREALRRATRATGRQARAAGAGASGRLDARAIQAQLLDYLLAP